MRIGVIGNAALDCTGRLAEAAGLAALIKEAGADTAYAGLIDDGSTGARIRDLLEESGVDASRLAVSQSPAIALGDYIDVAELFAMDAVVIVVSDFRLHRFLVDLPVHTTPNARLIGLLSHLIVQPLADALEVTLLHDLVVATDAEIALLTKIEDRTRAIDDFQQRMVGANLRSAAIFRANDDSVIVTKSERWKGPVDSFYQLAARAAVTFARRDPWTDVFTADGNA